MKSKLTIALLALCVVFASVIGWGWGTYGDTIGENKVLVDKVTEWQLAYKSQEAKYNSSIKTKNLIIKKLNLQLDQKDEIIVSLQKQLAEQAQQDWGCKGLQDFPDMASLLHFLADDPTNQKDYIRSSDESEAYVCEQFAFQLMANAASQGYRLYPIIVFSFSGNYVVAKHMMCFAIVTEKMAGWGEHEWIVAIEPQSDEVMIIGRLHDVDSWVTKWYPFLP